MFAIDRKDFSPALPRRARHQLTGRDKNLFVCQANSFSSLDGLISRD
jgi:hypothetical protein